MTSGGDASLLADLQKAHRRLEHLFEIIKLFANFENVEETFDSALMIVTQTLPIRSAILIEKVDGRTKMILWPAANHNSEEMHVAKGHVESAYVYLVGADSTASLGISEKAGMTALPAQAPRSPTGAGRRFLVIPLVIGGRALFGALQIEAAHPLEETDLVFVNVVANQLAIALERHREWRGDITRRDHAERGKADAEGRTAAAEHQRSTAEEGARRSATLAFENHRLYEEARHAVQMREQILAIVSHDLRNPLGAILMTVDQLVRRGGEERRQGSRDVLTRVKRAAQRMQRLIDDLLDFASIEAGRLSIRRERHAASSLIEEAVASFEQDSQKRGLSLTAELEPDLPMVDCDRGRVLQVFSNLVGNAANVMTTGGAITLSARAHAHEVVFSVADTGPGISEEDTKHLFERYWRSKGAGYTGTGLGLAIARGVVTAHGGRMWVESELGRGATFFFSLPAVAPLADDA